MLKIASTHLFCFLLGSMTMWVGWASYGTQELLPARRNAGPSSAELAELENCIEEEKKLLERTHGNSSDLAALPKGRPFYVGKSANQLFDEVSEVSWNDCIAFFENQPKHWIPSTFDKVLPWEGACPVAINIASKKALARLREFSDSTFISLWRDRV